MVDESRASRDRRIVREDFDELDELFHSILKGELKAPAELTVRIFEERQELRERLRRLEAYSLYGSAL